MQGVSAMTYDKKIDFVMDEKNSALTNQASLLTIGVGGGGGNAVEHMVRKGIEGIRFVCVNTDSQVLALSSAEPVQIGLETTRGLGAGANPEKGRQAAIEQQQAIEQLLEGCNMVFITAGMGGGTGTGAAPFIAEIAKEKGVLAVAIVTKPFLFEGGRRMKNAEHGIAELAQQVNCMITIPNQRLVDKQDLSRPLQELFSKVNDVLLNAVQGISEIITRPGLINVDFADVEAVMSEKGPAVMGIGTAKGENRAQEALEKAIHSDLLENVDIKGARGILINITATDELRADEFVTINDIASQVSKNATVIVGSAVDNAMGDELRVTVVITGLPSESLESVSDTIVRPIVPRVQQQLFGQAKEGFRGVSDKRLNTAGADGSMDIPAFLRKQAD